MVARIVLSSGVQLLAESYEKGSSGFAVAKWAEGSILQLEIPNGCIQGGNLTSAPKPLPPPVKKRPAAGPKAPASAAAPKPLPPPVTDEVSNARFTELFDGKENEGADEDAEAEGENEAADEDADAEGERG